MKLARNLKPGDKVNGHERGWMIVKSRKGKFLIWVTYQTEAGEYETYYWPDEKIETV